MELVKVVLVVCSIVIHSLPSVSQLTSERLGSYASDPFEVPEGEKLQVDDGSGELTQDVLPPAGRINEGVVDRGRPPSTDAVDAISQPHRTQTMPSASVVLSQPPSSLRVEYETSWQNVLHQNGFAVGDITGIAINSAGNVILLHSGSYRFHDSDFSEDNRYVGDRNRPIAQAVLVEFDAASGQLLRQWARHLLFVPHGLSVDDDDNVWVTDIALHQVLKFAVNSDSPSLQLGSRFEPGSDSEHFCQPTDVAVMNTDIYVADGLCNTRIVHYSEDGRYIQHWDIDSAHAPAGRSFQLLSLAVNRRAQQVCVGRSVAADMLCYDAAGKQTSSLSTAGVSVFGVTYNVLSGDLYAVGSSSNSAVVVSMIEPHSNSIVAAWQIHNITTPTPPYDIAVSLDTSYVYISAAGPPSVWKFHVINTAASGHQSVKKGGVKPPPTATHISVDSGTDDSADDDIERSVEEPSVVAASLVIASLIVVPLSVVLVITLCARLYRQGKLPFFGARRYNRRLNLGNLLSHGRNGVGFHQLTTLDNDFNDELDPLRSDDSDVEEFSSIALHQRPA